MANKVIKLKNLPARLPWYQFTVIFLVMDKFHAPAWLWGCIITICTIITAALIYAKYNEEDVDIFSGRYK